LLRADAESDHFLRVEVWLVSESRVHSCRWRQLSCLPLFFHSCPQFLLSSRLFGLLTLPAAISPVSTSSRFQLAVQLFLLLPPTSFFALGISLHKQPEVTRVHLICGDADSLVLFLLESIGRFLFFQSM
jgi:hypothetical protein